MSEQPTSIQSPPAGNKGRRQKPSPTDPLVLFKKAREGDRDAALTYLRLYPSSAANLAKAVGDVGKLAEDALLELIFSTKDELMPEICRRVCAEKRADLEGPNPSPLEKMLVHQVVLCWLHLHFFERQYAATLQQSMSLQKSEYYQRIIDRAQRRYLGAIKSLAIVRRLQIPVVQVNVAEKQLNVVQTGNGRVGGAIGDD